MSNINISTDNMSNPEESISNRACSLSILIVGILLILSGCYITYIYYTEVTPPNYEAHYQRYVGSSLPRIFGEYNDIFPPSTMKMKKLEI